MHLLPIFTCNIKGLLAKSGSKAQLHEKNTSKCKEKHEQRQFEEYP